MWICGIVSLVFAAAEPDDGLAKKMLPIYIREASDYSMTVGTGPMKKKLELKKEPVFEWSDPTRDNGQITQGVVFLWLRDGRPAAIGTIFSEPRNEWKGRTVLHEFHALDPEQLTVTRPKDAMNEWKPEAGLARKELDGTPAPAATPAARLVQMRRLAQEITCERVDDKGNRLDLRFLPTPLFRYPEAANGVIDGALFTFVSSTDPEALLLLEARETKDGTRWEFACGRFSDRSLYMKRKDKEVWSCVRNEENTILHDAKHLYRVYPDKIVTLEGKLIARLKATEKQWWGEFYKADEK